MDPFGVDLGAVSLIYQTGPLHRVLFIGSDRKVLSYRLALEVGRAPGRAPGPGREGPGEGGRRDHRLGRVWEAARGPKMIRFFVNGSNMVCFPLFCIPGAGSLHGERTSLLRLTSSNLQVKPYCSVI